MATCTVFGYIVDGTDTPIEGIDIQFLPASLPSINSSTGKAIYPNTIQCTTSSTGYFGVNLLVNTDFLVVIRALGIKEVIRIPDGATKNLFELTSTYVSGDPTPDSTGETNW